MIEITKNYNLLKVKKQKNKQSKQKPKNIFVSPCEYNFLMDNHILKQAYIEHLKYIKMKHCSYQTKILLIQGLREKLKFIHNNPQLMTLGSVQKSLIYHTPSPKKSLFSKKQTPSENQSTSYSFYSDSSEILPTPQDYQEKIMEKRVIKFQINQEIQALEDDLFQIQKVVDTKRAFNDQLGKSITKKMKDIGETTKLVKEDSFLLRTPGRPNKDKEVKFDLNATVSGASGFGFSTKKLESGNQSLNSSLSIKKEDMSMGHIPIDDSGQRKKARSTIGRGIAGIFKNILK